MEEERRMTLGELVEECIDAAWSDWRVQKAPATSKEEARAILQEHTTTQIMHMRNGVLNVTVTCAGNRINDAEVYFWRYRRRPNGTFILVGSTLDL